MLTESQVQLLSLIVAFGGFVALIAITVFQSLNSRRMSKREIYQRLEFASIDLFRFEFEHSEKTFRLYDKNYQLPPQDTKEYRDVLNHATQILNLFEMIVMFRKEQIISAQIFSSWVAWFWDMSQTVNFVSIWKEAHMNYTSELQLILNAGMNADNWNQYLTDINKYYHCKFIEQLRTE